MEWKHATRWRGIWVISATLMLLVAVAACSKPQEAPPPWKVIDASTLRAMMTSDKELPVFNTMSELECLDHRIPGTRCLPCEEVENNPSVLPADKNRDMVFYCESAQCYRSCRAAEAAVKAGYRQVYVLDGGMPAWKEAGYALETIERVPRMPVVSVRAAELRNMLAERRDILLVDIRSEQSYKEVHIDGAVNIPLYQITRRYDEIPLDCTVVLVDDRGFRTFLAGSYLERKGFKVMRLFAGMRGWQEMLTGKKQA